MRACTRGENCTLSCSTTLAVIQLLFTIGFVVSLVRNFTQRQRLISVCTEGDTSD